MPQPVIATVDGVSKRFVMHKEKSLKERIVNAGTLRRHRDDFWALRDVNLEVNLGDTLGLVGHNGSGKSTLLKVIGGIIDPTEGKVSRRGRLAALLELGAGFHADLTGRENVYLNAAILGLTRKETDRYFDAIVDFSGIEEFIDTQVKFYSSGMYVRLAFAVAVHVDPDLLLVDEVLAVGDEPFQRKCMDKIEEFQREGRTIVLVSHSAEQVGRLCNRIAVLDHGVLQFEGDPADGLRVLRFGFEQARLEHESAHGMNLARTAAIKGVVPVSADVRGDRVVIDEQGELTFEYSYELTTQQEPLTAGLAIETAAAQSVYGINTLMTGTAIPTTPGTHKVMFRFPQHSLGGGQFVVRASLERADGTPLDRMNPACTFEVPAPQYGAGVLRMDAAVSIES